VTNYRMWRIGDAMPALNNRIEGVVFFAGWQQNTAAEALVEKSGAEGSSKRHVSTTADTAEVCDLKPVGVTWSQSKGSGSKLWPGHQDIAGDGRHIGIGKFCKQEPEPGCLRHAIIIQECHKGCSTVPDARVPGAGEPRQWLYDHANAEAFGDLLIRGIHRRTVHHQNFSWGMRLEEEALQTPGQMQGTVTRANHHRAVVDRGHFFIVNHNRPIACNKSAETISDNGNMPYSEILIAPMRQDLARYGVEETRTPQDVDRVLAEPGTLLMITNSVCGCAAGKARPGIGMALQSAIRPDKTATVFAGADEAAVAHLRSILHDVPPSSPQIALFKDGKPVFIVHRRDVEMRDPYQIANLLTEAFKQHCAPQTTNA